MILFEFKTSNFIHVISYNWRCFHNYARYNFHKCIENILIAHALIDFI